MTFAEAEVKRLADGKANEFKQLVTKTWPAAIQADPEVGGSHFDQTQQHVDRVLSRFATPEFKKALNETGLGNHPELVRVFSRIGKAMRDDKFETASGNAGAGKRPIQDILFGDPVK